MSHKLLQNMSFYSRGGFNCFVVVAHAGSIWRHCSCLDSHGERETLDGQDNEAAVLIYTHRECGWALFHPPPQTEQPLVRYMDKVTKRLCILFALRSCGRKVSILFLFIVIFPISNLPSNGVVSSSASFIILCVSWFPGTRDNYTNLVNCILTIITI